MANTSSLELFHVLSALTVICSQLSFIQNKYLLDPTASIRGYSVFDVIRFTAILRESLRHLRLVRILFRAIKKVRLRTRDHQAPEGLLTSIPTSINLSSLKSSARVKGGKIQPLSVANIDDGMDPEECDKVSSVTRGRLAKLARNDTLPNYNFFSKKCEKKVLLYLAFTLSGKLDLQRPEKLTVLLADFLEEADLPEDAFVDLQAKKLGPQGIETGLLDRLQHITTHIFGNAGRFVQATMEERMRMEVFRLGSFVHLNDLDHVTAIRLANAGFFFAFEGRALQCFSCGIRWDDWQLAQNPYEKNRHRPDCKHIHGQDKRNVPIHERQTSFRSGTDITGNASTNESVAATCSESHRSLQESFGKFTEDLARSRPSDPAVPPGNEGESRSRTNRPEDVPVIGQSTGASRVPPAPVSVLASKSNADDNNCRDPADGAVPPDNNLRTIRQGADQLPAGGAVQMHSPQPRVFAQARSGGDNASASVPNIHHGRLPRTLLNTLSSHWNTNAAGNTPPLTLPQSLQEARGMLDEADRTAEQPRTPQDQTALVPRNGCMEQQTLNFFTQDSVEARINACGPFPRDLPDRGLQAMATPPGQPSAHHNVHRAEVRPPDLSNGRFSTQNIYANHFSYSSSAQSRLSGGNVSADIVGYADYLMASMNNVANSSTRSFSSDPPIIEGDLASRGTTSILGVAQNGQFGPPMQSIEFRHPLVPDGSTASISTTPSFSSARGSTPPVRQTATTSASADSQPPPVGATGGSASFPHDGAAYPEYADRNSRLQSYRLWPPHVGQSPEELADCGFYYTGTEDCVRCFHCGLGLKHWEAGDDPEEEHERWRGTCAYIRFRREQEVAAWRRALSTDVQREYLASPPSSRQNEEETNSASDGDSNLPTSAHAARVSGGIPRHRNWMASRPATAAREMGFDDDVIQEAIFALLETRAGPRAVTPQNLFQAILYLGERGNQGRQSPDWRRGLADLDDLSFRDQDNFSVSSASGDSRDDDEISNDPESPTEVGEGRGKSDVTADVGETICVNAAGAGHCREGKLHNSNADVICRDNDTARSKENLNKAMLRQLEEENKELLERQRCKICLDRDINVLLLPCAHRVCCSDCIMRLRRCPLCRARIHSVVLVR